MVSAIYVVYYLFTMSNFTLDKVHSFHFSFKKLLLSENLSGTKMFIVCWDKHHDANFTQIPCLTVEPWQGRLLKYLR